MTVQENGAGARKRFGQPGKFPLPRSPCLWLAFLRLSLSAIGGLAILVGPVGAKLQCEDI